MKSLLSVLAKAFFSAAALTLVLGALNAAFGWSLGLSVGATDVALPDDFVGVVAAAVVLFILAGILQIFSDPKAAWEKKGFYLGIALVLAACIGGSIFYAMGGGLGVAVERGDTDTVIRLLGEDAYDPALMDEYLYQALKNGHLEMADALVKAGGDLNHSSGEFKTPLLSSGILYFPKASVLHMLAKGAKANAQDALGRNPAHLLLLYRSGSKTEETPQDRLEILKALHAAGTDLTAKTENGDTVSSLAESYNYKWATEYLDNAKP